jgi:starch synthase (maltosyl-transferring)
VVIERVRPSVDDGRFPIKRTVGESVTVRADVFADGRDALSVVLRDRRVAATPGAGNDAPAEASWRETAMSPVAAGTDEWTATFDVLDVGWHEYAILGWVDRFKTWTADLEIKAAAGQDVALDLLEGSLIVREAAARAADADAKALLELSDQLNSERPLESRVQTALASEAATLMAACADRSRATPSNVLRVWVDRERARFGAWYEMFPRSAGPDEHRSGTFTDACAELPRIADLGFDVLYLPPIHPIGTSFRKGPNNSLRAGPGDPGSPWAIGSDAGGHTAIEPGLGTVDDFLTFRKAAERLGLEIALDLAWQCSPDHPWVREHPEWFRHRPDGTIRHAENPPKKYEDIVPLDFENEDWPSLWRALLDVTRVWIERGVRIFRVDNPHTKTFGFWEWLIEQVHAGAPDVVFLSEAFTRPALMRRLAKEGFSQSYSYFTWRNTKEEITQYFTELSGTDVGEYLRVNLFANTPDILHEYLQHGGRAAFETRLLLAATLGASYGIYSGFELCEHAAVGPGSEEYADSEKYQFKKRCWDRPGNLNELVCRVNRIRREHPALHGDRTLRFHATDNDHIVAFSKTAGFERLLIVVNLDPHRMQEGQVDAPFDADYYPVHDLLDDTTYTWHRGWNYVRFDPDVRQAHIFTEGPRTGTGG